MRQRELREIFDRTRGHCHFCGDPVTFENRGWATNLDGYWEVDHVIQRQKGGIKETANCLPACTRCNRLRWHRTGEAVRELLFLGLLARDEIIKDTPIGRQLALIRKTRLNANRRKHQGGEAPEDFDAKNLKPQNKKHPKGGESESAA